MSKLDSFTEAYIECALWSTNDESTPEGGEPLDNNYGPEDLSPECLATMVADCNKFQEENAKDIATWENEYHYTAREMAGHDFWLTRNSHGAGFWDGDWPDRSGARLSKASETFEHVDLCVGDNGLIYC